jgi:D-3-phosphoglycerate dehydrogenase
MNVIGFDPFPPQQLPAGVKVVTLDELIAKSDFITLHIPLLPETKNLFGAATFAKMKKGSYLINCARGGVVDEAALIDALQRNRLAGAGLDVFEKEPVDPNNPLLKMDNVSLTNHYASYSEAAWERAQTQLGEEAVRIANGMWPMSLINPDVRHVIPPRTAARSWEVYSRELTVGRHR